MDILQKTVIAFFPMAVSFCLQIVGYEKSQGLFPGFFYGGVSVGISVLDGLLDAGDKPGNLGNKKPASSGLFLCGSMVPTEGFEPPHLAAHGPEPCASTNSATWAFFQIVSPAVQNEVAII